MKKIFLPLLFLIMMSCSVDDDPITLDNEQSSLNSTMEIETCDLVSYDFADVGKVEVTDNLDMLYVTVDATGEGYALQDAKLHVALTESGFPTVGQGNLPPGAMKHQIKFDPMVGEHTFEIPLGELEPGDYVYIASQSSFSNAGEIVTAWAGDVHVDHGNWSYFKYQIQDCTSGCTDPVYTGPDVLSATIPYSVAVGVGSVDEARKLFSNQVIATGAYYGSGHDFEDFTRYSPSIKAIVAEFGALEQPFGSHDLTTTYSYGEGECAGTIDITLTIIDDGK